MPAKRTWTDEERAEVRELVAAGKSNREIAMQMGSTRNAICGLTFRMGLATPHPPEREKRTKPAPPRIVVSNEVVPPNDPQAMAIWNYFQAVDRAEQRRAASHQPRKARA